MIKKEQERMLKKAEALQLLAGKDKSGKRLSLQQMMDVREAYAQRIAAPILQEVSTQASIMSIFTTFSVEPREQAEFQVELSTLPSTDKFTGAPTSVLLTYNHPGIGPTSGQVLGSKTFVVPTDFFEHESGFPRYAAERALFSFEEAHRRRMRNAVVKNVEDNGWTLIQNTISNVSFPATQSVEIAAGEPGAGTFSRQLFGKMLKLALDVGLATEGGYTPSIWVSNQSFEEMKNWDIATEFSTSEPAQISENLKAQLNNMEGLASVGSYGNIPIVALRRHATGDITANKDYAYLLLQSDIPNGLVLPIRQSALFNTQTGLEDMFPMEISNDPIATYQDNEIRQKARWQAGYACLDARVIYAGVIDRT